MEIVNNEYLAVFIIIAAEIPSVVDDPEAVGERAEKVDTMTLC